MVATKKSMLRKTHSKKKSSLRLKKKSKKRLPKVGKKYTDFSNRVRNHTRSRKLSRKKSGGAFGQDMFLPYTEKKEKDLLEKAGEFVKSFSGGSKLVF